MDGIAVETCFICSNSEDVLNDEETDAEDIDWKTKLKFCLPELDWTHSCTLCRKCGEQLDTVCDFRTKCLTSYLQRHDVKNVGVKTKCKLCLNDFHVRTELFKHNLDVHNTEDPYDCSLCSRSFHHREQLADHETKHYTLQKYFCDECKTGYSDSEHFAEHTIVKHAKSEDWCFDCGKCGLNFPSEDYLRKHANVMHDTEYTCYNCGVKFSEKEALIEHIREVHEVIACFSCGSVFNTRKKLEIHKSACVDKTNMLLSDEAGCVNNCTNESAVKHMKVGLRCNSPERKSIANLRIRQGKRSIEVDPRCNIQVEINNEETRNKRINLYAAGNVQQQHNLENHNANFLTEFQECGNNNSTAREKPVEIPNAALNNKMHHDEIVKVDDLFQQYEIQQLNETNIIDSLKVDDVQTTEQRVIKVEKGNRASYSCVNVQRLENANLDIRQENRNETNVNVQAGNEKLYVAIQQGIEVARGSYLNLQSNEVRSLNESGEKYENTVNLDLLQQNGVINGSLNVQVNGMNDSSFPHESEVRLEKIAVSLSNDVEQRGEVTILNDISYSTSSCLNPGVEVNKNDSSCSTEEDANLREDSVGRIKRFRKAKAKSAYSTEKEKNECEMCGVRFSARYLLTRHVRNVHATEKVHKCDECEQKFASSVYLAAHKKYHSGNRPHICSFCGKGYITTSDLYHHEKIHANKRAYKCEKCPKAFNTSSDLHKHKICVHLDRSLWKYVCSYCERRFPLKTNLDTHVKTHTGERNYACHLCDRRCINQSVLQRHIDSHSNVCSFRCQHCGQDYKHKKSLNLHLAKVHGIGELKVPQAVRKFFCPFCPRAYFANNKLQKHIRTHTGERPFSCKICAKTFIDKSYVKQHMKTTHNVTD